MDIQRTSLILVGGGLFQGLLVASVLLARPSKSPHPNRFLAALIVVCSLNIAHPFISLFWTRGFPLAAIRLSEPLQFAVTPLILAYVRSLLDPAFRPRPWHLIHFAPAFLAAGFSLTSAAARLERGSSLPLTTIILWILLLVQAACYLTLAGRLLHHYQAALRNSVSNLAGIDLNWMSWFFIIFFALYLSYVVLLVLMISSTRFPPVRAYLAVALTIVVWVVGYRGLLQKEPPNVEEAEEIAPQAEPAPKYERSGLPDRDAAALEEKLLSIMSEERIFLDPELSLSALADRLGAARNQISFVINQRLGRNFFDFVNEYRVKEVIRLMGEPAQRHKKILALAQDAGFNSKPTFNAVFKKVTGKTPSDFRSSLESES